MDYPLDGLLHYLGRDLPDAFAPVTLRTANGVQLPLFREPVAAAPFLVRAPAGVTLERVEADDLRAKEELLRAALEGGAVGVLIDPRDDGLEPVLALATAQALAYIVSHKNETTCI